MATFDDIAPDLERQAIELPSWAFGNSGTRFKVFAQPGVPRDPVREDRRRRAGASVHRAGADRSRCTSRGTASTTSTSCAATPTTSVCGSGRSTRTRSRTTTTSSAACVTSTSVVRAKAIAHMHECVDIMDVTGSRDLKVWLPDGLNYPGQGDLRDRQERLADSLAPGLRAARAPPAAGARVQVLRARVLRDRRARLGHGVRALRRARRARRRVPRHRPPRAGYQHRVHRHAAAAARPPRCVRLQLALLRGRRPDRRRRRPVPAVPHPVRGRARRWLRPRQRRRVHARPVPQHRGEDPRSDPLGAERAGDDGARVARRSRRPGGRGARRRRAGRERGDDGRVLHRRARRSRASGARVVGCPRIRSTPIDGAGTPSASSPSESAAPRPGGARDAPGRRATARRARTGSAPTRATRTTRAATPPRRASIGIPSRAQTSSCSG